MEELLTIIKEKEQEGQMKKKCLSSCIEWGIQREEGAGPHHPNVWNGEVTGDGGSGWEGLRNLMVQP